MSRSIIKSLHQHRSRQTPTACRADCPGPVPIRVGVEEGPLIAVRSGPAFRVAARYTSAKSPEAGAAGLCGSASFSRDRRSVDDWLAIRQFRLTAAQRLRTIERSVFRGQPTGYLMAAGRGSVRLLPLSTPL